MRVLSSERFSKFLEVSTHYYSWDIILQNANITQISDKGDQYEITCPFHEDKRPSCRLSKHTGVYHCFSCGRKGTYTRFMWELQGKPGSYSDYCEQVLKSNPAMQQELRFTSLYLTEKTLDAGFNTRRVFNRASHLGSGLPLTSLVDAIKKIDDSWESMVLSLTLLQEGMSTDGVLTVVKQQNVDVMSTGERMSLMDLLEVE